jgi:hypothetical protein
VLHLHVLIDGVLDLADQLLREVACQLGALVHECDLLGVLNTQHLLHQRGRINRLNTLILDELLPFLCEWTCLLLFRHCAQLYWNIYINVPAGLPH